MRAPALAAAAIALGLAACSLEEPDETLPIVIIGWPPDGAVVGTADDIRVLAAARDAGGNLASIEVRVGGTGGCYENAIVTTNGEILTIDRTMSCRPEGAVSIRATAWDESGWTGEYGPVAITVEPR